MKKLPLIANDVLLNIMSKIKTMKMNISNNEEVDDAKIIVYI